MNQLNPNIAAILNSNFLRTPSHCRIVALSPAFAEAYANPQRRATDHPSGDVAVGMLTPAQQGQLTAPTDPCELNANTLVDAHHQALNDSIELAEDAITFILHNVHSIPTSLLRRLSSVQQRGATLAGL